MIKWIKYNKIAIVEQLICLKNYPNCLVILKKERNKRNLLYWSTICLENWTDKLRI